MTHWHPIFVRILRPVVEAYYDVQTTVPVGDAPRQADLVLLRRTSARRPPFRGMWRHLTTWNVLEYKGPTVSPRLRDLDRLVELGLGIDRRLNEERERQNQPPLDTRQVSFWYLANHLGRRFLRDAPRRLGALEPIGEGIWRCAVLDRLVFLVSGIELAVEEDSLPLHLVGKEPRETEQAVGRFLANQPALWEKFGSWLAYLHDETWKEVEKMARTAGKEIKVNWDPLVKAYKEDPQFRERFWEIVGVRNFIKDVGMDKIIANLSAAERRELRRRLND